MPPRAEVQELDEASGIGVPIQTETAEELPAEEEQPTVESGSEDNGNN